MEKVQAARPHRPRAGARLGSARLIGAFAFVLTLGFFAPALAQGCPEGSDVFRPNGQWARADLGAKASTLRILAIGSSSTQGIGASQPAHSYPADLEALLDARFPARSIQVVNAGIGGENASQTVSRLVAALDAGGYDLVIWQVGTNDAVENVDRDGFKAILEQGVSAARHAAVPMILVDPQYFPDAKHPNVYASFVDIVDDIGKQRGVAVFSRYALMRAWANEPSGLLATMLAKDSFHMSDRGYACWASLLADDIASRIPAIVAANKNPPRKPVLPSGAAGTPLPAP